MLLSPFRKCGDVRIEFDVTCLPSGRVGKHLVAEERRAGVRAAPGKIIGRRPGEVGIQITREACKLTKVAVGPVSKPTRTAFGALDLTNAAIVSGSGATIPSRTTDPISLTTQIDVCLSDTSNPPSSGSIPNYPMLQKSLATSGKVILSL